MLLLAGVFIALGVWQLQRRAWKQALIAQVEARVHAPPTPLPARGQWRAAAEDAYRRVAVEGHFLRDRETLVRATTVLGSGYWVLTPLRTADGTILVNRGFVPPERREAGLHDAPGDGPVRVIGLLRQSEPGGGFLRSNRPADDRWYSRDVAAIAERRGIRDAAPFFLDAEAEPGPPRYPAAGLTVIRFTDNHLAYALTWFGLAALSAAGAVCVLRARAGDERG
jgi:surfeit locus 1 family protein